MDAAEAVLAVGRAFPQFAETCDSARTQCWDPSKSSVRLRWIDERPLVECIKPYRQRLFAQFFDEQDAGCVRFNLGLFGRAKKNWKSADLALADFIASSASHQWVTRAIATFWRTTPNRPGRSVIGEKTRESNGVLQASLTLNRQHRTEGRARLFLTVLPAQDVVGTHGKSYRLYRGTTRFTATVHGTSWKRCSPILTGRMRRSGLRVTRPSFIDPVSRCSICVKPGGRAKIRGCYFMVGRRILTISPTTSTRIPRPAQTPRQAVG